MLRLDDNRYFSKQFTYFFWLLMSFQAGYVNVGGFFISGSFVSHVTGTSSRIGMGLADVDFTVLATFVTILFAFIGGACFAGHHIGRKQDEGQDPRYTFVLMIKAFFFGLVLYISSGHLPESILVKDAQNILILFFLSFCCGVQNATCALSTGGFLKPTHMTGLSTDIGMWLAKNRTTQRSKEEIFKNRLRVSILGSFIFGGVMASVIFHVNGHYGFLFPFVTALCFLAAGIIRDTKKREARKSWGFKTATGSVIATFLTTIALGVSGII